MDKDTAMNIGVLLIPIAVLFFSRKPVREKDATAAIGWEIAIRMATAAWLVLFLVLILPRFHAVFSGFGVELPAITTLLMKSADHSSPLCWMLISIIPMSLAAEVVLFATLRQTEDQVSAANRVSIGTTLLVIAGFALIAISLFLPLIKLLNDLS